MLLFFYCVQWLSGGNSIALLSQLVYKNKQPVVELMHWIVSHRFPVGKHTAWLPQLQRLWAH